MASRYVVRILQHRLAPTGIQPYQLGLVTHIRHAQPVTPTEISAASGVPPTTLRDNVQRLVDRGLVERRPNPNDGRSYFLVVTERGAELLHEAGEALLRAYELLEAELGGPLTEREAWLEELNRALTLVLARLEGDEDQVAAIDSSSP